jgi:hypothetical protein
VQKPNTSLICKFCFRVGSEIQSQFLAAAFFQIVFVSGFQSAGFQVWLFRSTSFLFISKVSGCFCRVAKIGFKVFGLRFGQLWF